jgi:Na+/proline symporter
LTFTPLDGAVIAVYFLFNSGIGLYYKSRAGSSTSDFFLSDRNVRPAPAPESASVME